jgi:oligopeptide transport system substrate-binding protein
LRNEESQQLASLKRSRYPVRAIRDVARIGNSSRQRDFAVRCLLGIALLWIAAPTLSAPWADPAKTLKAVFEIDVTGLDPAGTQDLYSNTIQARIFDSLYEWDYLARPYRYVPSLAALMPDISADGRTWTIRIKPGFYFSDDPAFNGEKRELTAADVAYSWKRLMDPRVHSPNADLVRGKFIGLDAAETKARTTGRFDYDADIEGLRALDKHTLQLKLVEPDYTLLSYLNSAALRIVAREVIEKYADESGRAMDHPIGTNAYRLKDWERGRKVVLEANANFREIYFPEAPPGSDAATKALAAGMKGKRLPQIGIVEISIVEESNPLLLMFDRGELDLINVPRELAPRVMDGEGRLLPAYARRGIDLQRATELGLAYTFFNMEDPVVGGYALEKVALRRAICSAYNIDEEIRIIRNGQGFRATQPIPPDVAGHVTGFNGFSAYDPKVARALLDKFGYADRNGDGFRELPDGKPLVIRMASEPDQTSRQYAELWQRGLTAAGLKVDFVIQRWPDHFKAARAGQVQVWTLGLTGGIADYYMLNFYGPSSGEANLGRFHNAEFDAMFLQSRCAPEDRERIRLYAKMTEIVAAYAPWCPNAFRISSTAVAPWVRGYKKNVYYYYPPWQYLDIDLARRKKG